MSAEQEDTTGRAAIDNDIDAQLRAYVDHLLRSRRVVVLTNVGEDRATVVCIAPTPEREEVTE